MCTDKSFRYRLLRINSHFVFLVILIKTFLAFSPSVSSRFTGFGNTNFNANANANGTPKNLLTATYKASSIRLYSSAEYAYLNPIYLWDTKTFEAVDSSIDFSLSSHSEKAVSIFLPRAGYQISPINSSGEFLDPLASIKYDYQKITFDIEATYSGDWSHPPAQLLSPAWEGHSQDKIGTNVTITYDATRKTLSVFKACYENSVQVCSHYSFFGFEIDLMRFMNSPNIMYGNSSCAGTSQHGDQSWEFNFILAVNLAILALVLAVLWLILKRRNIKTPSNGHDYTEQGFTSIGRCFEAGDLPRQFSLEELNTATNGFAYERMLGEGGSGVVYKGNLGAELVAVKKMFTESRSAFTNELRVLRRLIHRNVVRFIGWCLGENELFLVYEYLPNGSLESHLHGTETTLPWHVRYRVAVDLVSAIHYLHEGAEKCVIHRDIKPENILLDEYFTAKLGDFGIAKLMSSSLRMSRTSTGKGTPGYLAPEYLEQPKASKEADIYSFGIVALEIASGRKPDPNEPVAFHNWIMQLYLAGNITDAADTRLQGNFDKDQMKQLLMVGLWCTRLSSKERPNVGEVIKLLQPGALPLSKLPIYGEDHPPAPAVALSLSLSKPW